MRIAGVPLETAAAAALVVFVFIIYLPAILWGGFVWDDLAHIPGESAISDWGGIVRIWFQPTEVAEPHYRPLTYTSFWLEHKLWGYNPMGYHTVNVLLHGATALLLWRVLGRLAVPAALIIVALWAVHPIRVESVAWAIERKDVLYGLLFVSSILVWLRFQERQTWANYALALLLFVAAALAKNMAVTLPAVLLILQWYRNGRISREDAYLVAPFFAVALGFVAIDLLLVTSASPADFHYSVFERALIASRAVWFYVGTTLWPFGLVVIYTHWDQQLGAPLGWSGIVVALSLLGMAGILGLTTALYVLRDRIGRGPLAGWLFFLVALSPALGLIEHTFMLFSFVADRYQYLAGLGLLAVLVGGAATLVARLDLRWRRAALGGAIGLTLFLGALTWQQSRIYQDQLTFFEYIATENPDANAAHLNLANAYSDAGRLEEARAAGLIAVERHSTEFDPYGNLVQIHVALGELDEALSLSTEALEKFPDEARAHGHVGLVLFNMGRHTQAESYFVQAVELDPEYADGRLGLGVVLMQQERYAEALEHLQVLTELSPGNAQGWANMGIVLLQLGRYSEAVDAFDRSLALMPGQGPVIAAREVAQGRLG